MQKATENKSQQVVKKPVFHWLYLDLGNQKRMDLQKELEISYPQLYNWFRDTSIIKKPYLDSAVRFFEIHYGVDFSDTLLTSMTRIEFANYYLAACSKLKK